jgi:hypothetical protein
MGEIQQSLSGFGLTLLSTDVWISHIQFELIASTHTVNSRTIQILGHGTGGRGIVDRAWREPNPQAWSLAVMVKKLISWKLFVHARQKLEPPALSADVLLPNKSVV